MSEYVSVVTEPFDKKVITNVLTEQKWISVKDRLPEKLPNVDYSRDVLFIDSKGIFYAGYFTQVSNSIFRWNANCGCSGGDFDVNLIVTYWQELPEPPK